MKCEKCGIELSDKVWMIHKDICKAKPENKTELKKPEIIKLLTEKNVKFNPRDKKEVLEALLNIEEKMISPEEVE